MSDWPDGYLFTHLKRDVLKRLVDEREEMAPKLQTHLDKTTLTYEEAVTEIKTRNNLEPIPKDLGDFVLAAISITIGRPIFIVKPVIERSKDANDRPVTRYNARLEYLFNGDKGKRSPGANNIVLV